MCWHSFAVRQNLKGVVCCDYLLLSVVFPEEVLRGILSVLCCFELVNWLSCSHNAVWTTVAWNDVSTAISLLTFLLRNGIVWETHWAWLHVINKWTHAMSIAPRRASYAFKHMKQSWVKKKRIPVAITASTCVWFFFFYIIDWCVLHRRADKVSCVNSAAKWPKLHEAL